MAITRIKADTALSGTIPATNISSASLSNVSTGTSWQAVKTTSFTAVAGEGYFVDTTSGAITATLPASPTAGDSVQFVDYAGTFGTNNLTIARNGSNIQGNAADGLIQTNRQAVTFTYVDATKGWVPSLDATTGEYGAQYITATGGTVATDGDYKIHTFTGDGCFVVTCAGNPGGSTQVDYLVIAGGGGGGFDRAGGGGAGGYRESHSVPVSGCYTASPLATPTGITVSATTYPITIGAGGPAGTGPAPSPAANQNGSNSVFSTITSTAGGGGATGNTPVNGTGRAGGSGGGGTGSGPCQGANAGAGNTPPVSPPQGNPGGPGYDTERSAGGGGGGAGASGEGAGNPYGAGDGGIGVGSAITGSNVLRAGGGGGGNTGPGPGQGGGTFGVGGINPGGSPSDPQANRYGAGVGGQSNGGASSSSAATANTGSGGGGGGGAANGSAGGSGIVIIRYKYQ